MKNQIKKFQSGTAQPQLPINSLIKFTIPMPKSLQKQSEIVEILKKVYLETQKLETIYQRKLEAIAELKQSILEKAFTGQLSQ